MRRKWEYAWVPITADGEVWGPRSEAECDELIAAHADPRHYINQAHNSDMSPVVRKRRMRRKPATEWEYA